MRATKLKKKIMLKIIVIALIILVPIFSFYFFVGPEFEISITQTWGRVTSDTTEIETLVAVNNPTPLSRWLKKIEFDLYINDLKIASESNEQSVEVKPLGKTEISFTSFLNNSRIPDLWVTYLNNGYSFDVRLAGNVTFNSAIRETVFPIDYETYADANLLELLNINEPKEISVGPTTLTLKSLTSFLGRVTVAQTEIKNFVVIYNPSNYTVKMTKVNCTIEMNGIKMVENVTNRAISLWANRTSSLGFTWILNNSLLNEWWSTHLTSDQMTRVAFKLQVVANVTGTEYSFSIVEREEEVSLRILGDTISFRYYLPIL